MQGIVESIVTNVKLFSLNLVSAKVRSVNNDTTRQLVLFRVSFGYLCKRYEKNDNGVM